MRRSIALALVALLFPADPSPGQFPTVPSEAVQLAAASNPGAGDFFLWFPEPSDTNFRATALVANAVLSHAPETVAPVSLQEGRLLRLNVFALAPRPEDRWRLLFVLHKAARDDPYFRDVTRAPIPLVGITVRGFDGALYTKAERPLAAHLIGALEALDQVRAATGLRDCVFHGGHLISLLSRQTRGGLYYDARGISKSGERPANRESETGLESYLRSRGLNWALSRAIDAESRAYISRSGVTGKPRLVVLMFGQGTAPHVGPQTIGVTLDMSDEDLLDPGKHPLVDLSSFRGSAAEVFVTLPNGHVETTIWDARWDLAQTVPDNIAADSTIPEPHTRRLEPFHSCIRCHGPNEFWQPVEPFQFAPRGAVDLLAGKSPEEAARLVFTHGGGDLSRPLDMARNTANTASFYAVAGNVPAGDSAAKLLANAHGALYASYNYDQVTPWRACVELGVEPSPPGASPEGVLADLLSSGPAFDPRLRMLIAGEPIGREEWAGVLHEALTRSAPRREWLMWEWFGVP